MTKDIQAFMSKHSSDSRYNSVIGKYRSKYFVPKVREVIRKHEAQAAAAYFSTQNVVNVTAYDQDNPIQQAAAEFFKELINARLTGSKRTSVDWFQYLVGGYQDAMSLGICIGKMTWNKELDKPDGVLVEPEYLLFDPSANWMDPINTSPYVIELRTMYVYQIKDAIKKGNFLPCIVTGKQIGRAHV